MGKKGDGHPITAARSQDQTFTEANSTQSFTAAVLFADDGFNGSTVI